MNIIGIGIDLVENKRIEKIWNKYKIKFANKILTKNEIENFKKNYNKIFFLAKSFATKEATVKALGSGFRNNITFKSIEINKNKYGKPNLVINIKKFRNKKYKLYVTISHEINQTIAFVILIKKTKLIS